MTWQLATYKKKVAMLPETAKIIRIPKPASHSHYHQQLATTLAAYACQLTQCLREAYILLANQLAINHAS